MTEPILRIPRKKYGGDTTVVSMRISKDLLRDIDQLAELTGRNRNEILTMSLEFAMNHIELINPEQEEHA
jgi:predicted transcriptional regulator